MAPRIKLPFTDGKNRQTLLLKEGDNLELLTVRMAQNGWYPAVTYKQARVINELDAPGKPVGYRSPRVR